MVDKAIHGVERSRKWRVTIVLWEMYIMELIWQESQTPSVNVIVRVFLVLTISVQYFTLLYCRLLSILYNILSQIYCPMFLSLHMYFYYFLCLCISIASEAILTHKPISPQGSTKCFWFRCNPNQVKQAIALVIQLFPLCVCVCLYVCMYVW